MKKILIIKLGYSETLDNALSLNTSLGDVLRTTVILHFFKNDDVSWLVDEKAAPLLKNNKYIRRVLIYSPLLFDKLSKEEFDIVINFEKLPDICRLSDSLHSREYFGFRFNGFEKNCHKCNANNAKLFELTNNLEARKNNKDCWQKILLEALGKKWRKESYVLGYLPAPKVKYDIGFNWTTGNKWTNKAWPKQYWHKLETMIKNRYSLSWQKGLGNIYEYIDWINSCKLIVTADSLGLHLGLALEKRVVALFGPTSPYEIHLYNLGSFLIPGVVRKCIPCFKAHCDKQKKCIGYISPEKVKEKIEIEIKRYKDSAKV